MTLASNSELAALWHRHLEQRLHDQGVANLVEIVGVEAGVARLHPALVEIGLENLEAQGLRRRQFGGAARQAGPVIGLLAGLLAGLPADGDAALNKAGDLRLAWQGHGVGDPGSAAQAGQSLRLAALQ